MSEEQAASAEPEGLRPPEWSPSRSRLDDERRTRKPLAPWDRVKFLLLFTVVWFVLVWSAMADNPLLTFADAARQQLRDARWILVLTGAEVVRQVHFLVSEHWAAYHQLWLRLFAGTERLTRRRLSDWTRYRLARAFKWVLFVVLVAVVLGKIYDTTPVLALFHAPATLISALPFIFQLAFGVIFILIQFIALFWFLSRGGVDVYFPDDIKTRFTDVWGQDHVLAKVKENIVFLEYPERIEEKGGYVPGGVLLWGPPGTGKTLIAEAVAGETGKPYVFVDPGAFTNMFFGIGILKVKSLFRKLRKLALRYGGVIVFFDEADSLGNRGLATGGGPGRPRSVPRSLPSPVPSPWALSWGSSGSSGSTSGPSSAPFAVSGCNGFSYLDPYTRSLLVRTAVSQGPARRADLPEPPRRNRFVMGAGMGGGGGMGTLQALLTEMSGLKKPRGFINRIVRRVLGMRPKPPPKYRILIMMATNLPEALDEALLRPGRIDRIYKVGYPSKAGRIRTYDGYFAKVSHGLSAKDVDKLATITPYATGATMKDLVNESLINAIRDGRDVITWRDVMKAKQLKELGPPEDVEYIERERHAVAVHEACHAVVAYRVRSHMEIDIATIEKGSDYLGMVASIPPEDQFTRWRTEYEADILVSLASLAGERLFFDKDNSSGVSGDLESATAVAAFMESHWGMGSGVASLPALQRLGIIGGVPEPTKKEPGIGFGGTPRRAEDSTGSILGQRIEFNLVRLLERAEQLLRNNRREVLGLAHALETHKTLTGEDVVAVIEGQEGPLVDGRPYHFEETEPLLEKYHEAAVTAHQGHTRPHLTFPVLRQSESAGVPAAVAAGSVPQDPPHPADPPVDAESTPPASGKPAGS